MQQHAAAKQAHPDCVVFFRLGDFYEMFGEDAVTVAKELGLTLTSRNRGKPDEIPMAGVPHHAAHGYIARLLDKGHRVAVCEQMADPKEVKGIVPREVVRVITPGTWTEADQLQDKANNWLCAVELASDGAAVALLDLSTAELRAARLGDLSQALSEIGRATPREVLLAAAPAEDGEEALRPELLVSAAEALGEVARGAQVRTEESFSKDQVELLLDGIDVGGAHPLAARAAARVLAYARACYKGKELPVWRIALWNPSGVLGIDRAAAAHLELVESGNEEADTSLLGVIDQTVTPGGARLLRRRLLAPLTDVEAIRRRLDAVEVLLQNPALQKSLRAELSVVGDLERLAVRASLRETNPRDLGLLRRGLAAAVETFSVLGELPDDESRQALGVHSEIDLAPEILEHLKRALVERPPAMAKEGAIFVPEYDEELAELAELKTSGTTRITEFEARVREMTGIGGLRVKFTRVFGWYVEVSRASVSRVPDDWRRKQTVASGERYTLAELDDLAADIASAEERFRTRELSLLGSLMDEVSAAAERVHRLAAVLAAIDVASSLAAVAAEYDYTRPSVDEGDALSIEDGRHPVVERLAAEGRFVPNDAKLTLREDHLWIISGPNMAGKSTFLRQTALCVILGQMGSYVPAKRAQIGVVDRVLSRVGASDNLAGGESTFMVEMRETANILRSATARSLVILDEVGRGTSTYDGLSIAWAVAEHLDQIVRCRALFATHYHELTELADASDTASNVCVSAREHEGEVVFLHRVVPGAASRSYGVEVARLAGLPESVLARARALLLTFEGNGPLRGEKQNKAGKAPQLDLFALGERSRVDEEALATIRAVDPDRLTPMEALQLVQQLKNQLG